MEISTNTVRTMGADLTPDMNRQFLDLLGTAIECLDDNKAVMLWNHFCELNKWFDDVIEPMDLIYDRLAGRSVREVLEQTKEVDIDDDWYTFTVWGLESLPDPWDKIDLSDLVDGIERDFDMYIPTLDAVGLNWFVDLHEVVEQWDELTGEQSATANLINYLTDKGESVDGLAGRLDELNTELLEVEKDYNSIVRQIMGGAD